MSPFAALQCNQLNNKPFTPVNGHPDLYASFCAPY
nr:MAG TPA: hypothetical protein [Caudoviricetes sp.]